MAMVGCRLVSDHHYVDVRALSSAAGLPMFGFGFRCRLAEDSTELYSYGHRLAEDSTSFLSMVELVLGNQQSFARNHEFLSSWLYQEYLDRPDSDGEYQDSRYRRLIALVLERITPWVAAMQKQQDMLFSTFITDLPLIDSSVMDSLGELCLHKPTALLAMKTIRNLILKRPAARDLGMEKLLWCTICSVETTQNSAVRFCQQSEKALAMFMAGVILPWLCSWLV